MLQRYQKDLIAIPVLTALYFCAGKLSLSLALVHVSASAIWPPTGLALAATLLLGYRVWPAIFVGAFLVNWEKQAAAPSLAIAVGNTLEAVWGRCWRGDLPAAHERSGSRPISFASFFSRRRPVRR